MRIHALPIVFLSLSQTQQLENQAAEAKKGLSLTKEQMLEAQEMFKTSNKVTRPEKALILGFMAGSRGECFVSLILSSSWALPGWLKILGI